ncbi:hypothetical protein LB507_000783, partial [Fusarium sp. FIESC RH6]
RIFWTAWPFALLSSSELHHVSAHRGFPPLSSSSCLVPAAKSLTKPRASCRDSHWRRKFRRTQFLYRIALYILNNSCLSGRSLDQAKDLEAISTTGPGHMWLFVVKFNDDMPIYRKRQPITALDTFEFDLCARLTSTPGSYKGEDRYSSWGRHQLYYIYYRFEGSYPPGMRQDFDRLPLYNISESALSIGVYHNSAMNHQAATRTCRTASMPRNNTKAHGHEKVSQCLKVNLFWLLFWTTIQPCERRFL